MRALIEEIKRVRNERGVDLRTAKQIVDEYWQDDRPTPTEAELKAAREASKAAFEEGRELARRGPVAMLIHDLDEIVNDIAEGSFTDDELCDLVDAAFRVVQAINKAPVAS